MMFSDAITFLIVTKVGGALIASAILAGLAHGLKSLINRRWMMDNYWRNVLVLAAFLFVINLIVQVVK